MADGTLRFGVPWALGVLSVGCASGPSTLLDWKVPEHQPVAIMVSISDQVNASDETGGVATLAETISNRLKEHGIDSQIYASKYDHPKPPRIDVYISHWHAPSTAAHQASAGALLIGPVAGLLAASAASSAGSVAGGGNGIVVDCTVFLPNKPQPAFTQRFESTRYSQDDNASAESAGDAIVSAILKH